MYLSEFEVKDWVGFVNVPEKNIIVYGIVFDDLDDGEQYSNVEVTNTSALWDYVQDIYVDGVDIRDNKLVLTISLLASQLAETEL